MTDTRPGGSTVRVAPLAARVITEELWAELEAA